MFVLTTSRNFKMKLLLLPRFKKQLLLVFADSFCCSLSYYFSLYLRTGNFAEPNTNLFLGMITSTFFLLLIFHQLDIYKHITRYSSFETYKSLMNGCLIFFVFELVLFGLFSSFQTPRTISVIQPVVLLILDLM